MDRSFPLPPPTVSAHTSTQKGICDISSPHFSRRSTSLAPSPFLHYQDVWSRYAGRSGAQHGRLSTQALPYAHSKRAAQLGCMARALQALGGRAPSVAMRVSKIRSRDNSVGVCRRRCRRHLPVAVVDINPYCCSDALLGFGLATHNTFAPKSPRA